MYGRLVVGRLGWAGVGPLNLVFYNRVVPGIGPPEVSLPGGGGGMWFHVIIKKKYVSNYNSLAASPAANAR